MRALVAVLLTFAFPAAAHAFPANSTVLLDRPATGDLPYDGNAYSDIGPHSISSNGCRIVFNSEADALSTADNDSATNAYLIDRCNGNAITLLSKTADGTPAEAGSTSDSVSISANGTKVAFSTNSTRLDPAGDGVIFEDVATGAITPEGVTTAGAPIPGFKRPVLSGNGKVVAFIAGTDAIYARDVTTATTATVVEHSQVYGLDVDFAGDSVAFVTSGALISGDTNPTDNDLYVRQDLFAAGAATRLASWNGAGQPDHADTSDGAPPAISPNGTVLAWSSHRAIFTATCNPSCGTATDNAIPHDGSAPSTGGADLVFFPASQSATAPSRVFWTTSSPYTAADTNGDGDMYSHDLGDATGGSTHLWTTTDGDVRQGDATDPQSAKIDPRIAYNAFGADDLPGSTPEVPSVYVGGVNISNPTGQLNGIYSSDLSGRHAVADNGAAVIFASRAPAFGSPQVPLGTNRELFRRDSATGTVTMLSRTAAGPSDDFVINGSLDAAGDRAVFIALGATQAHAYLANASETLRRIDNRPDGGPPASGVGAAEISGDGKYAVFTSGAPDVAGNPGDAFTHVYRVDLETGETTLVDKTAAGVVANGNAFDVDINGDGSVVAFSTAATNLGSPAAAVWVARLPARDLTFASLEPNGTPAAVSGFALSRDATHLVFTTATEVDERDLSGGTSNFENGSRTDGHPAFFLPSVSADGSRIGYVQLGVGAFVRDADGTQHRIDAADGTDAGVPVPTLNGVIDATGRCGVFSAGGGFTTPTYGPDYSHIYLRAIDDCPPATATPIPSPTPTPTPSPTATPTPTPKPKHTKPVLSHVRLSRATFNHAKHTVLSFRLNVQAKVTVAFAKDHRKRFAKSGKAIVLKGVKAGRHTLTIRGRRFSVGRFRLTLSAVDATGAKAKTVRKPFRIV